MYEISWYAQNALYVAFIIETLKRTGAHWLRANLPQAERFYPAAIKAIGLALSILICVVAKADALVTLEIYGFHYVVGYLAGGVMIFGGNTLIDAAWDKRKELAEIAASFRTVGNA